jgi:hypothetical protein
MAAGVLTILAPVYLSGVDETFAFESIEPRSQKILSKLTRTKFDRSVGTSFWLRPENSYPVELELIDVNGDDEQFSVVFLSPEALSFSQDTYLIKHAELGEFDLFLVPWSQDRAGMHYVASFNCMRFRTL